MSPDERGRWTLDDENAYWRRENLRRAAEAEAAAENARARRFADLEDQLAHMAVLDADVLSADELATVAAMRDLVERLRRIW